METPITKERAPYQSGSISSKTETTAVASLATASSFNTERPSEPSFGSHDGEGTGEAALVQMITQEVMAVLKGGTHENSQAFHGLSIQSSMGLVKVVKEAVDECGVASVSRSISMSTNATSAQTGSSTSTASGVSALSMLVTDKGVFDISHPDFWSEKPQLNDGASTMLDLPNVAPLLVDFVKQLDEGSLTKSSTNGDSGSVSSDISGLTGVFSNSGRDAAPITPKRSFDLKEDRMCEAVHSKGKGYAVRFDKVSVRSYERILSDHPSTRKGPSLGLGWEFTEEKDFDFEDWEIKHGRVRRVSELHMDRNQREAIVRGLGYNDREIAAAIRASNKIQCQRRQTITNLGIAQVEEAVEKLKRAAKKLMFLGPQRIDHR